MFLFTLSDETVFKVKVSNFNKTSPKNIFVVYYTMIIAVMYTNVCAEM